MNMNTYLEIHASNTRLCRSCLRSCTCVTGSSLKFALFYLFLGFSLVIVPLQSNLQCSLFQSLPLQKDEFGNYKDRSEGAQGLRIECAFMAFLSLRTTASHTRTKIRLQVWLKWLCFVKWHEKIFTVCTMFLSRDAWRLFTFCTWNAW